MLAQITAWIEFIASVLFFGMAVTILVWAWRAYRRMTR